MSKKRKRKSGLKSTLTTLLISLLMVFAAGSGIYCAKLFTTPYSSDLVSRLDEDTLDEVEISKDKCNILLMGTDKAGSLTDVMMLAQIDPDNSKVTVMSIPRDTRVKYKGSWMKINAVHATGFRKGVPEGIEAAILAVKDLTGIPVNHFIKINFTAFRDCIDALGGVEFDVPRNMNYDDPYQDLHIHLKKGLQVLDGDKAEQLVRFRRYKNGDIDRIKVQQDFLHALIEQKLQVKNISKINKIYRIVAKNMETSMTPDDAVQGAMQIMSAGKENIQTITLPNDPKYIGEISYVIPRTNEIADVRESIFGYDEDGNEIK